MPDIPIIGGTSFFWVVKHRTGSLPIPADQGAECQFQW